MSGNPGGGPGPALTEQEEEGSVPGPTAVFHLHRQGHADDSRELTHLCQKLPQDYLPLKFNHHDACQKHMCLKVDNLVLTDWNIPTQAWTVTDSSRPSEAILGSRCQGRATPSRELHLQWGVHTFSPRWSSPGAFPGGMG